jgi:hypothetical protein
VLLALFGLILARYRVVRRFAFFETNSKQVAGNVIEVFA